MAAAPVELEPAPDLSVPENVAMFLAIREGLCLVKRKDPVTLDAAGEKVTGEGERIEFKDGVLRVPVGGFVKGSRGEKIDSGEAIEFLEGHALFGNREEGFWRHHELAPAPTEDELDLIAVAAEERDLGALERLIAAEQAGWGREQYLEVAERSRARVAARVGAEDDEDA